MGKKKDVSTGLEHSDTVTSAKPNFLPDEDPLQFANLKAALNNDFLPNSAYERVLVNDLVLLEWEASRHRLIREKTIENTFCELVHEVLHRWETETIELIQSNEAVEEEETMTYLSAWEKTQIIMDPSHESRPQIVKHMETIGQSVQGLLAEAYNEVADDVAHHEYMISQVEKRRRRLVNDLHQLRGTRAHQINETTLDQ